MGSDLRDRQVGNLLSQTLQAAVFLDPSFHLLDEIQRHVDGAGFPFLFEYEVMARVLLSPLAAATGAPAARGWPFAIFSAIAPSRLPSPD
jgi:hypothetical protein